MEEQCFTVYCAATGSGLQHHLCWTLHWRTRPRSERSWSQNGQTVVWPIVICWLWVMSNGPTVTNLGAFIISFNHFQGSVWLDSLGDPKFQSGENATWAYCPGSTTKQGQQPLWGTPMEEWALDCEIDCEFPNPIPLGYIFQAGVWGCDTANQQLGRMGW